MLPPVRGRCALGRRAAVPGEGSSEREGAAGARQVEPWGAAAATANLGLGSVARGARRRGAKRPGTPGAAGTGP